MDSFQTFQFLFQEEQSCLRGEQPDRRIYFAAGALRGDVPLSRANNNTTGQHQRYW